MTATGGGDARARLRELIHANCFKQGRFVLASGRESTVFFDLKAILLDPEGINLVAEAVLARLRGTGVQAIGGLVMGAVPIVVATVAGSHGGAQPLTGFWVRKEPKDHGTGRLIDGPLEPGMRTVVVEDVTTTGESVLKAVRAVAAFGAEVAAILTVVDRDEGARAYLKAETGLDLIALYDRSDFVGRETERRKTSL